MRARVAKVMFLRLNSDHIPDVKRINTGLTHNLEVQGKEARLLAGEAHQKGAGEFMLDQGDWWLLLFFRFGVDSSVL